MLEFMHLDLFYFIFFNLILLKLKILSESKNQDSVAFLYV